MEEKKFENMVTEERKCITPRKKRNTLYLGDKEGYDYIKCPVPNCGKIYRSSITHHLWKEHYMTPEEAKEKYGITMRPKKYIEMTNSNRKNCNTTNISEEEMEGYDYQICPECKTKIRSNMKKHLMHFHKKSYKEADEIIKNNPKLFMTSKKYSMNFENYINYLKDRNLNIVDGRIEEISKEMIKEKQEKNNEIEGDDYIICPIDGKKLYDSMMWYLKWHYHMNKSELEELKKKYPNIQMVPKRWYMSKEEFMKKYNIEKDKNKEETKIKENKIIEEKIKEEDKEKEEKERKIKEGEYKKTVYIKLVNRQLETEKRIEKVEKTIDMLRNIFSKISIDLEGINIKS